MQVGIEVDGADQGSAEQAHRLHVEAGPHQDEPLHPFEDAEGQEEENILELVEVIGGAGVVIEVDEDEGPVRSWIEA